MFVKCLCREPVEFLCWYSCFTELQMVRTKGLEPGHVLCLQVRIRRQSRAGPSLPSNSQENFKGRAFTVPDSRRGVGAMGDRQSPYSFKKSLGCFCAAIWHLVKNEALVSPLLPPLLAEVGRCFWKPGLNAGPN